MSIALLVSIDSSLLFYGLSALLIMQCFNSFWERVVEKEPVSRQVRSAQEILFQTLGRMTSDPNVRRTLHMLHNMDCF